MKNSLDWLKNYGNQEVDIYSDWLIVSNFKVVDELLDQSLLIENTEYGMIQILKAKGMKCDRCWHYQEDIVEGVKNTNLCKRCAEIIK